MTFQESDLQFQFSDADWQVKKYDTHRYFKILSGVGLKGIDFLGIYKKEQVVLFEVKNYHTNHPTKSPNYLILENTSAFIESIIDKWEDTLRAIKVIDEYLQRQWWYRFFLKYTKFIPLVFIQQKDWYFWHRVQTLIETQKETVFVVWIEIVSGHSTAFIDALLKKIEKTLKTELKDYKIKVLISNKDKPAFENSLAVS